MTHKCCDDEHYLHYSGDCGDPDPCTERWHINEVRSRKAKKQGATIALIVAGVAAVIGLAFFLVAQGIVVLDGDGRVIFVQPDPAPETKDVNISADKVGITADKVIVDKDKKKDKHDDY